MDARLVLHEKKAYGTGFVEIVVWAVPTPVARSVHGFKYRLVYVVDGRRLVGYDNERGKGDHRHVSGVESSYVFVDVPTLLADFLRDVSKVRR
jgi:hypothetical protein